MGRIWSGTLRRQKDPDHQRGGEGRAVRGDGRRITCSIYDQNGVLLGRIREGGYHGQRFRIFADRLFLVDSDVEMAVIEYGIVED